MSNYEDHPPRLSDEEVFVIFDVVSKRGEPKEAQEIIHKKLHLRRPHRTTIARVFNVSVELFKREPNASALTTQEAEEIAIKAGYNTSHSRVVELHRLYQLWKIHRFKEKEKQNVDTALSTLAERRLKVWFLRLQHWDEGEIAEKLDISLENVQHDIEETEKEVASKTKEETKMEQNQSMVNLPPWVEQAQGEHLEGREQRDELGMGMGVVTYPGGIGIRQQLDVFKGCFPDIHPRSHSFHHPPDDENVIAQLRGHLPDEPFWNRAKRFWEKTRKCDALLETAYKRFTSVGEKLAPLSTGDPYITSGWAREVVLQALGPPLGFKYQPQYRVDASGEGNSWLTCDERIYKGPEVAKAKQEHQQLVEDFRQTKEFSLIVSLMRELQNLRQQILARIDQCLRKREYYFNYCPDCPADQARKMLASKGE